ncbi:hypothetical protein EUGRSUZ_D01205 [Eucalyptus grandis]|uniref:Uncharacterized protein n=1 Tax=Eucalyptus grandis TaxID=71139 RepID=A0A059CEQ2_EUCGR|nr:hypothetical protein EUGRSUZ_D01205 [Eucalyptus grandis]
MNSLISPSLPLEICLDNRLHHDLVLHVPSKWSYFDGRTTLMTLASLYPHSNPLPLSSFAWLRHPRSI